MLGSLGIIVIIHQIGNIFMMKMYSFIFGFDSCPRAHLRPESVQRFI